MQRGYHLLIALTVLLAGSATFGQMSFEEAMKKLQESEQRTAPTGEPPKQLKDDQWRKLAVEGVPYIEIVLDGMVAPPMAAYMDVMFNKAKAANIKHVVIRVDSDGGYLMEAEEIAEVMLAHHEDFTFHAVVAKGISAAIWPITLCDNIFVTQTSVIGGALVFQLEQTTGNVQVDQKMLSIMAAKVSARAEQRGHAPALIRGMMINENEVFYHKTDDGQYHFYEDRPANRDVVQLKRKDSILTLTAQECVRYGLANAMLPGTHAVGEHLGFDSWNQVIVDGEVAREYAETHRIAGWLCERVSNWRAFRPQQPRATAEDVRRYGARDARLAERAIGRMIDRDVEETERIIQSFYDSLKELTEELGNAIGDDPRLYPRIWDGDNQHYIIDSIESWQEASERAARSNSRIWSAAHRAMDRFNRLDHSNLPDARQIEEFLEDVRNQFRHQKTMIEKIAAEGYPEGG